MGHLGLPHELCDQTTSISSVVAAELVGAKIEKEAQKPVILCGSGHIQNLIDVRPPV